MLRSRPPANRRLPAIHINWTAPFFAGRRRDGLRSRASRYALPFAELVTTVHSALAWTRHHGQITLFTDTPGARYYEALGLLDLYSAVDTRTLDQIDPAEFNPRLHFTFGKLAALERQSVPFAMVDTDLIISGPVRQFVGPVFGFAHWETVDGRLYGPPEAYPNPNRVRLSGWDWSLRVCNTALAYFGHAGHHRSFVGKAIRFLRHNDAPDRGLHPKARTLFAEQRISGFEAQRLEVPLVPVMNATWDPLRGQFLDGEPRWPFHHTWVRKQLFSQDAGYYLDYCVERVAQLLVDFPGELDRIRRWPGSRRYLERFDRLASAS